MIQCNGCGFGVNEAMRFALMKNICPSCGAGLFSNKDSSILNMIQSRLVSERFASSLTETQIYDISLFFFNEIKTGFVRQVFSDYNPTKVVPLSDSDDPEISDIRKEVEAEMAEQLEQLTDDGDVVSEDILSKADRLKKLHQQRALTNPSLSLESPTKAPRRNSFRGISRST